MKRKEVCDMIDNIPIIDRLKAEKKELAIAIGSNDLELKPHKFRGVSYVRIQQMINGFEMAILNFKPDEWATFKDIANQFVTIVCRSGCDDVDDEVFFCEEGEITPSTGEAEKGPDNKSGGREEKRSV